MTDTLRILDIYRWPVAHDERALGVLAVVARDRRVTEEDIARITGLPLKIIRSTLTTLFRASLLNRDAERYHLSALGAGVAAGFGLNTAATASILKKALVPLRERRLLTMCYDHRHVLEHVRADAIVEMLSLWCVMREERVVESVEPSGGASRIPFAIIVGADPDLHRHGAEHYSRLLCDYANSQEASIDVWGALASACEVARLDVQYSDRLILFSERIRDPSHMDAALTVTVVRVLSALSNAGRYPFSSSLGAMKAESADFLCRELADWRPRVVEFMHDTLRQSGRIGNEGLPGASPASVVAAALRALLQSTPFVGQSADLMGWWVTEGRPQKMPAGVSEEGHRDAGGWTGVLMRLREWLAYLIRRRHRA